MNQSNGQQPGANSTSQSQTAAARALGPMQQSDDCYFFRLPPELRNIIYHYTMLKSYLQRQDDDEEMDEDILETGFEALAPIVRVNRQIYSETRAMAAFNVNTRFFVARTTMPQGVRVAADFARMHLLTMPPEWAWCNSFLIYLPRRSWRLKTWLWPIIKLQWQIQKIPQGQREVRPDAESAVLALDIRYLPEADPSVGDSVGRQAWSRAVDHLLRLAQVGGYRGWRLADMRAQFDIEVAELLREEAIRRGIAL